MRAVLDEVPSCTHGINPDKKRYFIDGTHRMELNQQIVKTAQPPGAVVSCLRDHCSQAFLDRSFLKCTHLVR